jgi:hypothetical protein
MCRTFRAAASHSSRRFDVCRRMLTYADACGRMLTYADVCRFRTFRAAARPTYADVCGHMLTYADVCRFWTFRAAASHSVLWKGSVATGALLVPPLPAAASSSAVPDAQHASGAGAHFTCFTGTKVQRLTRQERSSAKRRRAWR